MVEERPMQMQMQVRVTQDGPYRVRGVPLVRTTVVESAYGEPIGWTTEEPIEAGHAYSLCRCGGSSTKPFCDDSHLTNGFDGTEVADHGPRADRMQVYSGDGVEVTDDPSLCTHVGFCTTRRTHVWEMIQETDDPEVKAQMLAMISRCPSGRLGQRPSADAAEVEPAYEPSVVVVRDGPLWIRGGVEVIGADGQPYEIRNRAALCRCGHSRNMPLCDGTHDEIGFRDAADGGVAGADAGGDAFSPRPGGTSGPRR